VTGTDLIPLPTFEGREIRATEHDGQVWISINDLSLAWGLARSTLGKHIERDPDLYAFTHLLVDNLSTVPLRCVNEEGLYLLLGSISNTQRLKPEVKELIRNFRKWVVPQVLKQFRKGEIVQQDQQLDEVVAFDLIEAKQIAKLTDTDPKILQAAILRKHGYPEIADAIRPAITRGETGWYNPTSLMKFCNDPDLTSERLNWYLKNKGFQVKDGFLWRLTPEGQKHGEEYQFNAPGGHSEPRIAWRKSILVASGLVKA
jgi:prophage antirepressor-like protein